MSITAFSEFTMGLINDMNELPPQLHIAHTGKKSVKAQRHHNLNLSIANEFRDLNLSFI